MSEQFVRFAEPRISLLPKPVVVVSSAYAGVVGATTIAWTGVVSSRPPVVSVSFLPDSFCRDLIIQSREFVVNVPGVSVLSRVEKFGSISGRIEEKLGISSSELDEFLVPSIEVNSPGIAGFLLNIECRLLSTVQLGLYDCFLGQILAVKARADVADASSHPKGGLDYSADPPIACMADQYWAGGKMLGTTRENKDHPHGSEH